MKKTVILGAALALATLSTSVLAAASGLVGDPAAGKAKSATCAGCHGADGNSMNPEWPTLAGQHAKYLAKQLAEFKAGDRQNAVMAPMAMPLSEQDMADLAAYFSSQTPKAGQADPAMVELGEKIFRAGNPATGVPACMGCHAPNGVGNPAANFPRLAGQHATYTRIQLENFASGNRANDAGKMMRNIAVKMTAAEMAAVASYIQGLN